MSVHWKFEFSASGPNDLIEKLHSSLSDMKSSEKSMEELRCRVKSTKWIVPDEPPKLFHHTMIVSSSYGFLVAEVERNYQGPDAIEDMAEQFPGLTFQGVGGVGPYWEYYHWFESRDGATTWHSIDLMEIGEAGSDFDPDEPFTLEDMARIERRISEGQQRIAREQSLLVNGQDYLKQQTTPPRQWSEEAQGWLVPGWVREPADLGNDSPDDPLNYLPDEAAREMCDLTQKICDRAKGSARKSDDAGSRSAVLENSIMASEILGRADDR